MGILDLCIQLRVTVQSWKPDRVTGGAGVVGTGDMEGWSIGEGVLSGGGMRE